MLDGVEGSVECNYANTAELWKDRKLNESRL